MCRECFNNKIETTTTHTVEIDDCIVVIKNVPCMQCDFCGEIFFDGVVSEKLDELIDGTRVIKQELAIIDYSKVA